MVRLIALVILITLFLILASSLATNTSVKGQKNATPSNNEVAKIWKTYDKYILPIILIIGTISACLIVRQNTIGHRIPLSTYTTLEKVQTQIIQIDAIIITGLFVVLAIAFQVPSLPSPQDPSLSIDVKSFIIGITVSTSFPFVVSAMFMSIFGFGPTVWTDPTTKIKPNVPLWQAKMALAFMIFGFMWILGDLIAILVLLV